MSILTPTRRDDQETSARSSWGVLGFAGGFLLTVAVAIVVFIVGGPEQETSPEPTLPVAGLDAITVIGSEFAFDPESMVLNQGATVTFDNQGVVVHNIEIEGVAGFRVEAEAGTTASGSLNASPGSYVIFCSIPGHREAGMVGTLTVAEG